MRNNLRLTRRSVASMLSEEREARLIGRRDALSQLQIKRVLRQNLVNVERVDLAVKGIPLKDVLPRQRAHGLSRPLQSSLDPLQLGRDRDTQILQRTVPIVINVQQLVLVPLRFPRRQKLGKGYGLIIGQANMPNRGSKHHKTTTPPPELGFRRVVFAP